MESKWISVKERVPTPFGGDSWIAIDHGNGKFLIDLGFVDGLGRWHWTESGSLVVMPVAYWQELKRPEAPGEGEK